MKKLLVVLMLFVSCALSFGCGEQSVGSKYENKGYIYIGVAINDGSKSEVVGYVEPEIVEKFINGNLTGKVMINHPLIEGEGIIVEGKNITRMQIGEGVE